jgi:hypothetical protein
MAECHLKRGDLLAFMLGSRNCTIFCYGRVAHNPTGTCENAFHPGSDFARKGSCDQKWKMKSVAAVNWLERAPLS